MISVERRDSLQLRISRIVKEGTTHELEWFLFVPGELGLNPHVLSEDAFYHGAIHVKRTYYSSQHHLPLVLSRLASRGKLDSSQYRLSLSLYAYQYAVALERATHQLLDALREQRRRERRGGDPLAPPGRATLGDGEAGAEETPPLEQRLETQCELALGILRRLRRNRPSDDRLYRHYAHIDNYLSWLTEQRLLALVTHLSRDKSFRELRERLLVIASAENRHRQQAEYNSTRVTRDPMRISNKMRLLRRLIEYPVTLKQHTQELGGAEQKAVKGLAAAVVMAFVSLALLEARATLGDITALFMLSVAGLYAAREIFKDDLRNTLWRLLRKGRPKWRRQYLDATSNALVGRQLEWFDYTRYAKLDTTIQQVRKRSVAQREELVMHYRSRSRMSPTRFLSGYEKTRETLTLDLSLLARLVEKDAQHVYWLKEGQVSREAVERRHLLNLVVRSRVGGQTRVQRWKVVMSRSRIVDVEKIEQQERQESASGRSGEGG